MNHDLADDAAGARWLAALDAGAPWRDALEQHLCAVDLVEAERTMQVLKEGRGAWVPLAIEEPATRERPAVAWLFGNALSGTATVLARLGFRVVVFDPSATRGAIAVHRDRWNGSGHVHHRVWSRALAASDLEGGDGPPALAVVEGPVPNALDPAGGLVRALTECGARRVWHVGDNRLGYKRSTGVRADLRVRSPLRFVRDALFGEGRTLAGFRRAVEPLGPARSLALYPHRWDFSLVVGLDDRRGPDLFLGPGERSNRVKIAGYRLGLFPWLTPSFAVGAPVPERSLVDRILREVGVRTGEDPGRLEHLIATRGNNALLLTNGTGGGTSSGRFAVHVPLGADQERQVRRHHRLLERLRVGGGTRLATPEPLWSGAIDGVFVQVERRVGAINAAQLVDERDRERVALPGCVALLAAARADDGSPRVLDEVELAEHVHGRAEAVAARAGREETARAVHALADRLAEALVNEPIPRVFGHGDLRAKHVAVETDGTPVALLDLGCAQPSDLPLVDLLNLVLHDRKDDARSSLGAAWIEARERRLPAALEAVLADYVERLGLSRAYDDAIRAAYPLFVAAAAERYWDYSRPRWVHRQFAI
ncbi:Phosphotransferase enzyme family protein [Planctomycetes bacterium Pla163]|uniref:Phosphotransferase enzyme family protein n=1 Tax=Rohdeia mirabilis TaxID=2528008 RepID=A0A518CYD7_9BACT|nr:Phosphotransferase enzyme family protein [Planctomycetes bacterium Pla163]